MNIEEIQNLIKFVAKAGVNEVEIEKKDFKIIIKSDSLAKKKNNQGPETTIVQQQIPVGIQPVTPVAQVTQPITQPVTNGNDTVSETKVTIENKKDDSSNYITVKSPMIGTFYRSSAPDKPPFVSVGDSIKEGEVICIIEAMKLFNEIEAEISGKIVKVLVDDASPVEYDQPLFLVEP